MHRTNVLLLLNIIVLSQFILYRQPRQEILRPPVIIFELFPMDARLLGFADHCAMMSR